MGRTFRDEAPFGDFVAEVEPRLRRALVAAYGHQVGREATAEALAWAWEHWDRVTGLDNAVGYLYRVGQTRARRLRRRHVQPLSESAVEDIAWVEPQLDAAIAHLTRHQRVAVVLCHGFQWTHREVAQLLGIGSSTVQNHVERGLRKLRADLGGDSCERAG